MQYTELIKCLSLEFRELAFGLFIPIHLCAYVKHVKYAKCVVDHCAWISKCSTYFVKTTEVAVEVLLMHLPARTEKTKETHSE
jgi:hypothetical protein